MPLQRTLALLLFGIAVMFTACVPFVRNAGTSIPSDRRTVDDVTRTYGPAARARLAGDFHAAGAAYPPQSITLLVIKDTAELELWVGSESKPTYIRTYPVQALSGVLGPKLREGDRQVPEGVYRIEGLNPNSSFHLSMKLDYPNAFDRANALLEGRDQPGSDIFIHGNAASVGCLAMGDAAIEELFVLAADSGRENIKVVIAPTDPRRAPLVASSTLPWLPALYRDIADEFDQYPRPTAAGIALPPGD